METYTYLHDVKETLLTHTVLVLEELVTWKRPGDVSTDGLLKRRRLLQKRRVRVLLGTVQINPTQQLPGYAAERLRDTLPN